MFIFVLNGRHSKVNFFLADVEDFDDLLIFGFLFCKVNRKKEKAVKGTKLLR